jgi:uncharacterized GH25 family protein
MSSSLHRKLLVAAWVSTGLLLFHGLCRIAPAQAGKASSETLNMIVLVKEADTGQPIGQAHLTLQFTEPGSLARFGKVNKITYNAKTDTQGRYKFVGINKGTIVLTVNVPGHQTYGKQLQLESDNQVFEVKLKKPQPLI